MAKVRVYELAKELGVESKVVLAKLQDMGEFVRSASSTVEPPVVRKLKEVFPAQPAGRGGSREEDHQEGRSQEGGPGCSRSSRQSQRPLLEPAAAADRPPAAAPQRRATCAEPAAH